MDAPIPWEIINNGQKLTVFSKNYNYYTSELNSTDFYIIYRAKNVLYIII